MIGWKKSDGFASDRNGWEAVIRKLPRAPAETLRGPAAVNRTLGYTTTPTALRVGRLHARI